MAGDRKRTNHRDKVVAGGGEAMRLIAELRQPLAAASNYVGTARTVLTATGGAQVAIAVDSLDKASAQILRAGNLLRELRGHIAHQGSGAAE